MDVLDLFVKIGVKDEASSEVEDLSEGIVGKLGKAAAKAGKAIATAFAVKKIVDFGKEAYDAYSNFEQLQGGVAKLFGNANMEIGEYAKSVGKSVDEITESYKRNEEAQKLVMQNASQAWKNAGMDANTYMETATSFSASLINSLGGDTKKAAEQTEVAMRAMSDNVNTFGTDMQSVQNAFQGFAKQNYTMLDNLKLGYGGTKTEMERLIKDANEWGAANGEASNLSISSFSDVVTAIEQIQKKQGIYGTTQKEALSTLEGSANAARNAWQNLVTEIGKPDADIGARISDMMTALLGEGGEGGLLRNATNEVKVIATNIVSGVGDAIGQGVSYIRDNGPQMLADAMSGIGDAIERLWTDMLDFRTDFNLVESLFGKDGESGIVGAVGDWLGKMGEAFSENWPYVQGQLESLGEEIWATLMTFGPQILEAGGKLILKLADGIYNALPGIAQGISDLAGNIFNFLVEHGPEILSAGVELFGKIADAIQESWPKWAAKLGEALGIILGNIANFAKDMFNKGVELVKGLLDGSTQEGEALRTWFSELPSTLLGLLSDAGTLLFDTGMALINGLLDGIGKVAPDVETAIRGAFQTVLDFFSAVGDFIQHPIESIKNGFEALMGSSDDAASDVSSNMSSVEGSVDKSMTGASKSIGKYNSTQLKNKSAKATVTGNAEDGKAKTAVENTQTAVSKLSDKSVSVNATGNVISGVASAAISSVVGWISSLRDKTVNVTTHQKTVKDNGGAWGGITPRYHATGGVRVANRYGKGVPLDVVGERGPEAIVPLTSHYGKDFAQMMGREAAKELANGSTGGSPTVTIYLEYGASDDAKSITMDIARELEMLGMTGA